MTGIESIWKESKINNLVYILRACSLFMPNFLKFVLAIDPRVGSSSKGEDRYSKIVSILATNAVVTIDDAKIYSEESKSYLDFALTYSPDPKQAQASPETVDKMTAIALQKAKGEYRNIIEIVRKIQL